MSKHRSWLIGFALSAITVCASFVVVSNFSLSESVLWAVAAVATPLALLVPRETWGIIERTYSQKVGQLLNIFGFRARSTGVLCAPSLS